MNPQPYLDFISKNYGDIKTLYVAPKPQLGRPVTDYLQLLYQPFLANSPTTRPSTKFLSASEFGNLIFASNPSQTLAHLHWMEFQTVKSAIGLLFKWFALSIYLLRGGHIIWTVHNLSPHRGKWIQANQLISRWLANKSEAVLIHCKAVEKQIVNAFHVEAKKLVVIPHVSYPLQKISYGEAGSILTSSFGLHLQEKMPTFLFFGQISSYKQIFPSVQAIIEKIKGCRIIVAGTVMSDGKRDASLLQQLATDQSVLHLIFQPIKDVEIRALFSVSDAVILNYKAILDSGVFHLSRSLETAIISRNIGCFTEWEEDPHVYLFDTETEMLDHIKTISKL